MPTYASLLGPDGTENNMGGTAQIVYWAPVSDILTFAKPAAAPANPYVNTLPFVMKQGKRFYELYTTIDTSEIDLGENGEIDGKSFKPSVKLFYPGLKPDGVQFINQIKNDKIVMLVPLADDTIVQIGMEKFFAYASASFKSTTTSGRGKGTEITVMSYQPNIYLYAAAVPLTPAP